MAGSGFTVDTEKLLEVANSVKRLREDLAGHTSAAGSLPQYQTKAAASVLRNALATFWDGEDVFATAYDTEHQGIVATMSAMLTQLDALERACRTTAGGYTTGEHESRTRVRQTEPGGW